jgi:hypothetical protein
MIHRCPVTPPIFIFRFSFDEEIYEHPCILLMILQITGIMPNLSSQSDKIMSANARL